MSTSTAIGLVAIAFIVAWNAFFVAAEYAFVAARRTRLEELAEHGSAPARRALAVVADPSRFVAAVQVAITISSLALGAVGQPALADLIEWVVGPADGVVATRAITALSVILAFAVITALHVVLGEILPKTATLAKPETVAMRVVGPVRLFMAIFRPFIWVLRELAQFATRVAGLPAASQGRLVHSEEELKLLVSASTEEGVLEAEEQEMLHKVFDFSETQVEDVMVPRPDIVALRVALTPTEAMGEVLRHPHTRYPVFDEDIDDVCGVVHLRRLVEALRNGGSEAADLRALLKPAYFVPETQKLGPLLSELRRTNTHMAIVVDEYGSTAGLVTLEDLLEEIVGEIADEFDVPEVTIRRLGKDRIRVDGSFPVEEFNERFGRDLPEDDYNTLGGIVFGELGRPAEPGDEVTLDGARFRVHETEGPRIQTIDVDFAPAARAGDSAA